ncbi:MAG: MBL fold metallo-hydrolase [Chloroflexota bacterium]
MNKPQVSRRDLLKGLGAGMLGAGLLTLNSSPAKAQISPTSEDVAAYYRFMLGDATMTVVSDNAGPLPAAFLGANQEAADMQEFFANLNLLNEDGETVTNTFLVLVMQVGDITAIFDTGNGVGVGKLIPTLDALGIGADGVTAIIGSHWHPDHTNGYSQDGTVNFPNATYYFPQEEYDALQANADSFGAGPLSKIAPVEEAGQLSLYNSGDEVIPRVQSIATPGHTPGHNAFLIQTAGARMIHFVDAVVNIHSTVSNPEWTFGFDADPDMAIESRTMLLNIAATEGIPVFGYHFSFPGTGHIIADGDSYRFIPVAF